MASKKKISKLKVFANMMARGYYTRSSIMNIKEKRIEI